MPEADAQQMDGPQGSSTRRLWRWPQRWRARIALGVVAAALVGVSTAWIGRERIANDVIDDYLTQNGVPATYTIASITPRQQVIENLVIGDPARPDLTAARMVIEIGVGWAGPEMRRATIEGARVFARFDGGKFTLGALDPLIFTGTDTAPALPAIDITIRDGRALLETDFGPVGLKLDGAGRLDSGFAGTLAVTAPGIGVDGCRAETATLYGELTTDKGAPRFDGPLRLTGLACGGATLATADIGTLVSLKRDFSAAQGDFKIDGRRAALADLTGGGLTGSARLGWSPARLVVAHDIALTDIRSSQGRLARLTADGRWRGGANDGGGQWDGQWDGSLRGTGLIPANDLTLSLATAERSVQGTLIAPLIAKARAGLGRALNGASFRADAIIRHKGGAAALIVPEASLNARGGAQVLALSRFSADIGPAGVTGLAGNILVGGEGLPNINGRVERQAGDRWTVRLAMAEYGAGTNRLAIPRLSLRRDAGGALMFDGVITASGDLPGGGVNGLTVPLEGTWSGARGLRLGTRCVPVQFRKLVVSGLALAGQQVTLCPDGPTPIFAYDGSARLAARTGPLRLAGTLGESPASFAASGVVLRYPQPFAIDNLTAQIGAPGSEVRMSAATLTGSFGGAMDGAFAGGAAQIDAVPLDFGAIAGRWSFANGTLRVDDAALSLTDRPVEGLARFSPMIARGATLLLADNRITADAILRHPASNRAVANVAISHDLDTAAGRTLFTVPGLTFDKAIQPEDLTYLAKGVIALAEGTITGGGRVDWNPDTITSGGTFASDNLDFAAAFGPVRGLSGKVVFTDLLNLTTAPDQTVTIAAINPGIEVLAGKVRFDMSGGTLLSLNDARFPFMGGELQMRPLVMDFSQPEARRYVFEITGLDAAKFVAQMELTNLSATGIFDGTVPIVFDANGNGRIDGGLLIARAGGGNVAYIGELTYEDLGTMGNYAFSALRSLDYTQMRVGLGGDLAGEIVTNFDFDGVRQGAGTSQNFITRRLAKLPIRFKVNVRSANFYELATMVRSFWDADYLGDPRSRFKVDNGRLVPVLNSVQPSESEDQP